MEGIIDTTCQVIPHTGATGISGFGLVPWGALYGACHDQRRWSHRVLRCHSLRIHPCVYRCNRDKTSSFVLVSSMCIGERKNVSLENGTADSSISLLVYQTYLLQDTMHTWLIYLLSFRSKRYSLTIYARFCVPYHIRPLSQAYTTRPYLQR